MNINFCVAALTRRGSELLPAIWDEALDLGGEAFDMSNAVIHKNDRRAVVNARAVDGTWNVPTWLEDDSGVLSFSQPPVSFTDEVSQVEWSHWALTTLKNDSGRRNAHPGYFGISMSGNGVLEIWNDTFGYGRVYAVQNEHFVAAGNHLGMVSLFSDDRLRVDTFGADVLAQLGFWPGDRTPIASVRKIEPAEVIRVGQEGTVSRRRYVSMDEAIGYESAPPNVNAVADAMGVLTSNGGSIVNLAPTVHLSGGQDSRVTAAAWVAGGKPATIHTIGTLQGEVDVAEELLTRLGHTRNLEERGLTHRVAIPNPRRLTEFSIQDRLKQAMLMWDGDFASGKLRAPVTRPPAKARLAIGGPNGEVMHATHYGSPELLREVRELQHPSDRLPKLFPHKLQSPESRQAVLQFFEQQQQFAIDLRHRDATALNIFQMMAKSRRWINAQLNSTSFTLLINPVFVRESINLTPEDRLDRHMQTALSRALVPQWEDVPYFKATHAQTTKEMKKRGIRTWETSPGSMEHLIHERTAWKRWFDQGKMRSLERAVHNEQGNSAHEAALNQAYVLDAIPDHVAQLERRRVASWERNS